MHNISNSNVLVLKSHFDESFLDSMDEFSWEDQKIYNYIVLNNLFARLLPCVIKKSDWGKKHSALMNKIVLKSLTDGILKSIESIKDIFSLIWNESFKNPIKEDEFLGQFEEHRSYLKELTISIKENNSLDVFVYLFKYLENDLNPDYDLVKEAISIFSKDEIMAFLRFTNHNLNPIDLCLRSNFKNVLNLLIKHKSDEELKKYFNFRFYAVINSNK